MPDLFNNSSNDYIYPALSPCPGATDDMYLEFMDDEIGIVAGSEILSKIDFSDFRIPVASYSTQIKIIHEGEVAYIPGLTKGLTGRQQGFTMPTLVTTDEDLDSLFMQIDFSINYYKDFAFVDSSIDASSNYTLNIDVDDAINIVLAAKDINTTAVYDPSNFFFIGTVDGYDFDITNVTLSLIDTSENTSSPFAYTANASTYELTEDLTLEIPYAKYPNGAMQGMILKGTFPSAASDSDKWIYINNVVSPYIVYEEDDVSLGLYEQFSKKVDVGRNVPGTTKILSAAEYLDYINSNNLWSKVGELAAQVSSVDPVGTTKNLVGGFYVFNPHAFDIQIEYILFI